MLAKHSLPLWPTAEETADPLALLSQQHQVLRGVLEWMPLAVGEDGQTDPRDGQVLRAAIDRALAWHHADEEAVLLPRLVGLGPVAEKMGETCRALHAAIEDAADEVSGCVTVICRGEPTDPARWRACCGALRAALEPAISFEDETVMPAVRVLLEVDDLRDMRSALRARADGRPALREILAGPGVSRGISTVTILRADRAPDLVRRYSEASQRAGACIGDIMTRDVRCTTPEVPLMELVTLFERCCITGAPVVDERGKVLGVVSQSDVVRTLAKARTIEGVRVLDAMMAVPFCVEETARIEDAAALLAWEGVHRLPVVNAKHEVVGIVSALDLVRWRGQHGETGDASPAGARTVRRA